jgi:hypothetical protein
MADYLREMEQFEHEVLSKIDSLVFEKILIGLLGQKYSVRTKNEIIEKGLNGILIDVSSVRHLLTASYSVPCKITGPGADNTAIVLELINQKAESAISKPLFRMTESGSISYLGLWG